MGVKGLWKLIESCGVPVPLETLEHKILGVDVSIWLHQAVRGFRGPGGAAVANAHLLTLFHRICKLLFYRIRPVFVFDGGVPHLKKQTLAARRLKRDVAASKAKQVRDRLLTNLLKSQAVRSALGKTGKGPSSVHVPRPQKKEKDMFELPPMPPPEEGVEEITDIKEESKEQVDILKDHNLPNLHQFDFESSEFKSLPVETQELILSELRTTRKQNSWALINHMPQEGENFAEFQMGRLMKRRQFQVALENTQEEIRKKRVVEMEAEMFGELEKHVSLTHRIISEDSAHSILVKKVKDDQAKNEEILIKKEEKGKSLMKKKNGNLDKDFLTEFAKQGIIRPIQNSDSDSDIEDPYYLDGDEEYGITSQRKTEMEEDGLLQIVGSLMENNGLTQDEILALIKQDPDTQDRPKKEVDDGSKPSTSGSASGFIYNPDADSSDDDSDLVEITESNDDVDVKEKTKAKEGEVTNVDKILETKNDSLWMKIVQQRLDDIVHTTTDKASPKKASVDTRKFDQNKHSNSNAESEKLKSVAISLDFDVKPLKMEDDIFADIFADFNDLPAANAKKPVDVNISRAKSGKINSQKTNSDATTKSVLRTKGGTDSGGKVSTNSDTKIDNVAKDLGINTELQSKIQDLVKLEIEKILKPQEGKILSKDSVQETRNEEEMVDDVEIMSSSDESDKESAENCVKKPLEKSAAANNAEEKKGNNTPVVMDSDSDDGDFEEVNEDENELSDGDVLQEYLSSNTVPTERKEENTLDRQEEKKNSGIPLQVEEDIISADDCSSVKSTENQSDVVAMDSNSQPNKVSNTEPEEADNEAMDVEDNVEVERPLEYSQDELKHLEEELASEQQALVAQAQKVERIASNLNDQMYGESQELLQLFGIPYLVAPMEAEAQCAYLNAMKLTTGTITDDSDIFLFGGSNVYKNFFNQTKHVEFFKGENIKANIGLDRDKMICLALLTGSDYTVGIESVGGVLAMEVLADFPGEGMACLNSLKKWWSVAHNSVSAAYQSKVKQRMSQITLPESFPNGEIFKAYHNPEVDESLEKFSWSVPNVDALRMFTMEKFGWNRAKADEILIPVMKKLGIKTSQTRIDSFYTNIKLVKESKISSKRVQDAIARNKGEVPLNVSSSSGSTKRKKPQARGAPKKKQKNDEEPVDCDRECGDEITEDLVPEKGDQAPKKPSRTLLIDPSESSSSPAKPKRGRPRKKAEEGEPQTSGPSSVSTIRREEEVKPKQKVTKEDMYAALLEKEKIAQREADKKAMEEKKRLAAQLLKGKMNKQKR